MASTKKIPRERLVHLRTKIQALVTELGSQSAVSTATKVSQPQISDFLTTGEGLGFPSLDKLAKYFGCNVEDVLAPGTLADLRKKKGSIRLVVARVARYESLEIVIRHPSNTGRWSEPAVAAARHMMLDADEDPGEQFWSQQLDRIDAVLGTVIPKTRTQTMTADAEEDLQPKMPGRP